MEIIKRVESKFSYVVKNLHSEIQEVESVVKNVQIHALAQGEHQEENEYVRGNS